MSQSLLVGGGIISSYTTSATITSSQAVAIPSGTKRIEALMCGGGGGGGTGGQGGGFGGLQIYNIPVVGTSLDVVIGAGGAVDTVGGTTTVSIGSTLYAAVGGGGFGRGSIATAGSGRYGAGGGGSATNGGAGGPPFSENCLWSALDVATRTGSPAGFVYTSNATTLFRALGAGATADSVTATDGYAGWGGGGGGSAVGNAGSGGGAGSGTGVAGAGGGGAGTGAALTGGSMASVSIWGLTGFAGGAGATAGGGGGGMLAVGAAAVTTTGGAGGNGGGGGGGGTVAGIGGNGFVIFRFYS